MQDGVTGPLYEERDELKARLAVRDEELRKAAAAAENMAEERTQLQYQVKRLDDKLVARDTCASGTHIFRCYGDVDTLTCETTVRHALLANCLNCNSP